MQKRLRPKAYYKAHRPRNWNSWRQWANWMFACERGGTQIVSMGIAMIDGEICTLLIGDVK